jgi:cell wall-associated NlpC family hydrolase
MPCNCNRRSKNLTRTARKGKRTLTLAQRRAELSGDQSATHAPPTPAEYLIESQYGSISAQKYQTSLDEWLNAPFRHMGQTWNGTDCIGLVLGVYKQLGLIPEALNPNEYARQWYLTDSQERHPAFEQLKASITLERIDDVSKLRAGDILCFAFGKGIEAHVGLLTARGTIIHSVAGEQADKVIESRFDDNRWRKRYVYAYRLSNSTSSTAGITENGG